MALTLTLRHQSTSGNAFGTGAYTAASFTPTSGRRLLVVAHMAQPTDAGAEGSNLTLSCSTGGVTSFTVAGTSPNAIPGWSYGSRAWISDQNTSGAAVTDLAVDCGAFSVENYRLVVWDVQDYGGIGATATGTDDGDGPVSLTLSAATASTSGVVAVGNNSLAGSATTMTPGAGWTEVEDVSRDTWWLFQVQTRGGSTSTAVDWDDCNVGGVGTAGATFFAFEVQEAAPTTALEQEGFRFGLDDGSESAHTWAAAQDANITATSSQSLLLNFVVNLTGDPGATSLKVQVSRNGVDEWADIPPQ